MGYNLQVLVESGGVMLMEVHHKKKLPIPKISFLLPVMFEISSEFS